MMGENMEMVNLYVGSGKVHFLVHKELLYNIIPYFDKMFRGHFEEAAMNSATFPEAMPSSFDLLVGWVYSGTIRPSAVRGSLNSSTVNRFYNLAEKISMPELMGPILDVLHDHERQENSCASLAIIADAYSTTPEHSTLRKHMCMSYAYRLWHENEEDSPAEPMSRRRMEVDGLALDLIRLTRLTGRNIHHLSIAMNGMHHVLRGMPRCWRRYVGLHPVI